MLSEADRLPDSPLVRPQLGLGTRPADGHGALEEAVRVGRVARHSRDRSCSNVAGILTHPERIRGRLRCR